MRFSKLFGKTSRQTPAEVESISHRLLLRAGMIAQTASGIYSYLPLGWRVLKKIEQIIREEINKTGGQELMLPVLQPFQLWQQSGRYISFGESLFTLKDRKEHDLVLGPTHEEVITELVHRYVQSYRDLPLLLYQIQTKFRDEPRPRGGLLRVREFIMKDLYSFDITEDGLDESYKKMAQAYKNIYTRLDLPVLMVEADSGAIGGKESHEFMLITDSGEDEVIYCSSCGYTANAEKAQFAKAKINTEDMLPLEEVSTPGTKTIEEVASFIGVPANQTLKAVFYSADGEFTFVVIRGDMEVNETKLRNALKCSELRLATDSEVNEVGIVAGFASPVGIKGIRVIADDSITQGSNFVVGANKMGYHFRNANYPRDFRVDLTTDIALAHAGYDCSKCGNKLSSARGIEVGHIFKLGTFLSEKLGAISLNSEGILQPIIMGCYGIGIGRLLAAIIEQSHDDKGIIWPLSVAPYQACLCSLCMDNSVVASASEDVYQKLKREGIEVLYDNRNESAGVKFNDADLLGIPLRLTLSPRTLKKQSIEIKWRAEKEFQLLPLDNIASTVKTLLGKKANLLK
ncbi:MAG: proline--tRNA ligase [Dehalococcoidia bacterium]|nr:proline--tRNA ligase [Dehalococcoidia bacterium]